MLNINFWRFICGLAEGHVVGQCVSPSLSRVRCPFLSDRYIFLTMPLLRSRSKLEETDFRRKLARVQSIHPQW
jgi:hypothetical protein